MGFGQRFETQAFIFIHKPLSNHRVYQVGWFDCGVKLFQEVEVKLSIVPDGLNIGAFHLSLHPRHQFL